MYTENRARSASVMMRMCSLRLLEPWVNWYQTTKVDYKTPSNDSRKQNFINIKKWGATVKLAPSIWIIHDFLNFDHHTSKLNYQTPPNDFILKNWFFYSCYANSTGISDSESWKWSVCWKRPCVGPSSKLILLDLMFMWL